MTLPALAEELELSGRAGAPVGGDELASACAAVRGECGWHVAPVVERHRVLVSGPRGPRLVLPSLRVVAVHAVRDVRTGREVTGWRGGNSGMLVCEHGWPRGEDNLEVELTHGYDTCPADLLAVIVQRARAVRDAAPPGVRSTTRTVGGVTVTTAYSDRATSATPADDGVLARYRV